MKFALKDQSFETSLVNVDATTGKTEDAINTSFVAAPGEVIFLAGLFKQIDTTAATGLPGTTRNHLPTAFLNIGTSCKVKKVVIGTTTAATVR